MTNEERELLDTALVERAELRRQLVAAVLAGKTLDADSIAAKLCRLTMLVDALQAPA